MASLNPQTQIREGQYYFLRTQDTANFLSPLHIEGGATDEDITVTTAGTAYKLSTNGTTQNTMTQTNVGLSVALPGKTLINATNTGTTITTPLTVTSYPASSAYFDIIPNATNTKIAQEGGTAVASITMNNDGSIVTTDTVNVSSSASRGASLSVGPDGGVQTEMDAQSYTFNTSSGEVGGIYCIGGIMELGVGPNTNIDPAISIDSQVNIHRYLEAANISCSSLNSGGAVTATNGAGTITMIATNDGGTISSGNGATNLSVLLGPNTSITAGLDASIVVQAQGAFTVNAGGGINLNGDTVSINGSVVNNSLVWSYSLGTDQYINMNPNPFSGSFCNWNNTIYESPGSTGRLSNSNTYWNVPIAGWYSFTITLTGTAADPTNYLSMELVQAGGSGTTSIGLVLYNFFAVYDTGVRLTVVRGNNTFAGQFTKHMNVGEYLIVMGGQAGNNNSWSNALGITQLNIQLLIAD